MSEYGKVNKLIGFYHEQGCDVKGTYAKTTMEKYAKKLV